MREKLLAIKADVPARLEQVETDTQLEALRVEVLGKKGALTAILRMMGQLSAEERPAMGQLANEIRTDIESMIASKKSELANRALNERLLAEKIDVTEPARKNKIGKRHPLDKVEEELCKRSEFYTETFFDPEAKSKENE